MLPRQSNLKLFLTDNLHLRGWRAAQLVEKTSLAPSTIYKILCGETPIPTLETLDSLAKALDIPLASLIEVCGFELGMTLVVTDQSAA